MSSKSMQEQVAALRREQILEAALQEFSEKGFHRTTTKAIAKRAGVGEGTIYNYFSSKQELLLGLLHQFNESEEREEDFAEALSGPLRPFLLRYITHRLEIMRQQKRVFRAVLPEILSNGELRERYMAEVIEPTFAVAIPVFKQLIAQGRFLSFEPQSHLRMMASSIVGLLLMILLEEPGVEEHWEKWPEYLLQLYFDPYLPAVEHGETT